MLVNFFVPLFVRSDKDPNRAMIAVTAGGIVNVVFDIVLVYPAQMGMAGAAIASVSGITVQWLVCLTHFLSKKNTIRISKPIKVLKKYFSNSKKAVCQDLLPNFQMRLLYLYLIYNC